MVVKYFKFNLPLENVYFYFNIHRGNAQVNWLGCSVK